MTIFMLLYYTFLWKKVYFKNKEKENKTYLILKLNILSFLSFIIVYGQVSYCYFQVNMMDSGLTIQPP